MGNCAAGCHFRPYSFASSPFDDFAEMKNSTRKIVCQHLSAPPLDGPPTMADRGLAESERGRRRSLPATRFSRVRTPQAIKEIGQRTCANRRKGRCIRNPRRQYLRTSPAATKLSAPPPCSGPGSHPLVLRLPSPTHPTSPHFARIVGQHSHLSANNCIKTSLISANAVFMQLDRLYVALTYLLSIW